MRNAVIAGVAIVLVAVLGYVGWSYWAVQQAAVRWEGAVPGILSEKIEKEGDVADIELVSRIDAPMADVFGAFQRPEDTPKYVAEIKQATVVEEADQKKRVEFHLTLLERLQVLTVDLTYDPSGESVGIKTFEGETDIDGAYALTPSPDGQKTLVTYRAKQRNKSALPIPVSTEKSAIKEQFKNLMCAIEKDLEGRGKLKREGPSMLCAAPGAA
jgi:hypothetical protein